MPEKYFTKFTQFVYRDKLALDITRRVKIEPKDKNNPYNFYPFLLQDNIRSDQVGEFYYNDPELDWLIYHTNKIIDPYYDWYNTTEQFNELLIEKYGSIENSMKKVWLYVNNWANDDSQISVSHYENILTNNWKKYYNPIWGPKAEIIGYNRKQDTIFQNTNRIIQYDIQFTSGNSFNIGELIDIKYSGEIVGSGEVEWSNNSILTIKNVSGNTIANSSIIIDLIGEESTTIATSNNMEMIHESIPLDEEVFWSPLYFYEKEMIKNESRKHINLINDQLSPFIIQEFETKLNG